MPIPLNQSPTVIRFIALIFSILAALYLLFASYAAISSVVSGEAIYHSGPRGIISENVSRTEHPEKFHEAMIYAWFPVLFSALIAWICFRFFRKLSN